MISYEEFLDTILSHAHDYLGSPGKSPSSSGRHSIVAFTPLYYRLCDEGDISTLEHEVEIALVNLADMAKAQYESGVYEDIAKFVWYDESDRETRSYTENRIAEKIRDMQDAGSFKKDEPVKYTGFPMPVSAMEAMIRKSVEGLFYEGYSNRDEKRVVKMRSVLKDKDYSHFQFGVSTRGYSNADRIVSITDALAAGIMNYLVNGDVLKNAR